MEHCPACAVSDGAYWRAALAADTRGGGEAYSLLRCAACGSAWVPREERPADPSILYTSARYAPVRGPAAVLLAPLRRLAMLERVRAVRRAKPSGRVLELGAGDGALVRALRRRGFQADGIDPHPQTDTVEAVAAETMTPSGARYDVVVAWHMLEHVDKPVDVLRRAREALAPDGRLVVATPNLASLQARIGGDRWFHQDVPRHLTLFTERGLCALLERAGFRVTDLRRFETQQSLLGMWQTLSNRVTPRRDVAFRALKRDGSVSPLAAAVAALAGTAALPVALLLEPVAALAGAGGSVIVTAAADTT